MSKDITKTALHKTTNSPIGLLVGWLHKYSPSQSVYRAQFAKFMSVLFTLSAVFVAISFYSVNTTEDRASVANIELAATIAMIASTFLLSATHNDTYWFFRSSRSKKIDERQRLVRQRVFHISYLLLGGIILVTLPFIPELAQRFSPIVLTTGRLSVPAFQVALFIYGLPSAVASWRKDA